MYFPMMLNMEGRSVIVIGGGRVAERKISSLLKAKASITVVSPQVTNQIGQWVKENRLRWINRLYQSGDLKDFFLVFIATNEKAINQKILQEVDQQKQLVNIVDQPSQCTFIVPAVVQKGKLQIAISTNGASPGLAKKIKQELEQVYGEEYEEYIDFLDDMRQWIMQHVPLQETRKQLFKELLQPVYFERIAKGEKDEVLKQFINRDNL